MKRNNSRILLGVLLVIIGMLFFADNFFCIPFHLTHYLFSLPGLFILIGIIILLNHRDGGAGYIFLIVGLVWFAARFTGIPVKILFFDFWPILLILLGLYIIFKRSGHKKVHASSMNENEAKDFEIGDDYIDEVAILGGGKRIYSSKNLKGGKVTTIFGGIDLDLLDCNLAEGRHFLDLTIIFGGVDIYLPKDWKVVVNVTPIFGGFDDNRRVDTNQVYEENKVLVIKGIVLFGGVNLKN